MYVWKGPITFSAKSTIFNNSSQTFQLGQKVILVLRGLLKPLERFILFRLKIQKKNLQHSVSQKSSV